MRLGLEKAVGGVENHFPVSGKEPQLERAAIVVGPMLKVAFPPDTAAELRSMMRTRLVESGAAAVPATKETSNANRAVIRFM